MEPSRRIENDNTHAIELQQNRATASESSLRRPAALLSSRNYTPTFEKRNKQKTAKTLTVVDLWLTGV